MSHNRITELNTLIKETHAEYNQRLRELNDELNKCYADMDIEMTEIEHTIYIKRDPMERSGKYIYSEYTGIIPKIILENILYFNPYGNTITIHKNNNILDNTILNSKKLIDFIKNIINNPVNLSHTPPTYSLIYV